MRPTFVLLSTLGPLAASLALVACPSFPADLCADSACTDSSTSPTADSDSPDSPSVTPDGSSTPDGSQLDGTTGPDGTTLVDSGGDTTVPTCDETADPKDSPPCIADTYGVFVSPSGSSTATGTKADPVDTITNALLKLGTKKRIYVCAGTYAERVSLSVPVSIFGGFDCASWAYSGASTKIGTPSTVGYALDIQNVASAIVISDLSITAAPGTSASPNSIAIRVVQSQDVSFKRTSATASNGFDFSGVVALKGADGQITLTNVAGDLTPKGRDAMAEVAGPKKDCTCSIGGTITSGGVGGGGGGGSGVAGKPSIPENPTGHNGSAGQGGDTNNNCGFGITGADAPDALPASMPNNLGVLTANTWLPTKGTDGGAGSVGQGGGGGGARDGAGGGGGCGGCPGGGGNGGEGGGASVALLSITSGVLAAPGSVFSSSSGGGGGTGGSGGTASTPGGGGNEGFSVTNGCQGGTGGKGGKGGAGSGGAGGIAAAILYKGTKPTATGATLNVGAGGSGGGGGAPNGNSGPTGSSGTFLDVSTL